MAEFKNALLQQAIADADTLKETAIANARLTLEDEFTPAIKSVLARRLRNESLGEEGTTDESADESTKTEELEEDLNTSGIGKGTGKPTLKSSGIGTKGAKPKNEKFWTGGELGEEGEALDEKTELKSSEIGAGDNKKPAGFKSSEIAEGIEGHETEDEKKFADGKDEKHGEEKDADEFDLDEIIRELEEDIANLDEESEEEEEEEEEEEDGFPTHRGEEEREEREEREEKEEGEEDEGVQHVSDPLKLNNPEAGIHAGLSVEDEEAGEEGGEESGKEEVPGSEIPGKEVPNDGKKDVDLDALLKELDEEELAADQRFNQAKSENEQLKDELAQHRHAIHKISKRLQEVNLLNAKLLFTNKLFKKEGLTNDQKITIVETFDRATTVREVKLVYSALVEAVIPRTKTTKTVPLRKNIVSEGFASKVSGKAPPVPTEKNSEIIVESKNAERLQFLAGIKPLND